VTDNLLRNTTVSASTALTPRPQPPRSLRGQALAEFALILPILVMLTGGAIDLARVYQASITLESATRNAVESAATISLDSTAAQTEAQRVLCAETQNLAGFVPGTGGVIETCTAPGVTVTSFARSGTAPGASYKYPLANVTVNAQLRFEMLLPWPGLPEGGWTLRSTQSYSILQGR
jgi:Flp pilus assembly protein TadG